MSHLVAILDARSQVHVAAGALEVRRADAVIETIHPHQLRELHLYGDAGLTTAARNLLMREGIDVVFLTAKKLTGLEVNDAVLEFDVPCGAGTLPVTATIDLNMTTFLARPPAVTISTPSSVACPGGLVLTANASDPDGDLQGVRWYVDDVLIAPGTSTLAMTRSHVLRAVARDARGAAKTHTKTVTCAPT